MWLRGGRGWHTWWIIQSSTWRKARYPGCRKHSSFIRSLLNILFSFLRLCQVKKTFFVVSRSCV